MFLHADSEDSDQTGRTYHFVGFVMRRLKCFTHAAFFSPRIILIKRHDLSCIILDVAINDELLCTTIYIPVKLLLRLFSKPFMLAKAIIIGWEIIMFYFGASLRHDNKVKHEKERAYIS